MSTFKRAVAAAGASKRFRHIVSWLMAIGLAVAAGGSGLAQDADLPDLTIRGLSFDAVELSRIGPEDHWQAVGFPQQLDAAAVAADIPQRRILQFSRPLNRADRTYLLRDIGLRLEVFVGGGYIERVTLDTVATLLDNGILHASVPYHPAFKLTPSLRDNPLRQTRQFSTDVRRNVPGLLLRAMLFPDADPDATAREILDIVQPIPGAAIVPDEARVRIARNRQFGAPDQIVIHLVADDADDLQAGLVRLAQIDGINSLEEVGEIISDNVGAASTNQSGSATLASIWSHGLTGNGQVIGMIDEGLPDLNHCLLNDPSKVVTTRNASMTPSGPTSHATFMAASAAGDETGNPGMHPQRGAAWGAALLLGNNNDLYEINITDPFSTLTTELNAASAYAFIHSNSWHDSDDPSVDTPLSGYSGRALEVDYFAWNNEDHIVLGSSGPGGDKWGPPGIAKNAIAVSAASVGSAMTFGAGFDAPTPSGRIKPDIVAAGCNISSALVNTSCGVVARGTCVSSSAATAHAAGIVALARQYFTEGWYPTGEPSLANAMTPTGALLKATLINSARDMTGEPTTANTFPSQREGWGIVKLDEALFFADDDPLGTELLVWDVRNADTTPIKALAQGESHTYSLSLRDNSRPLKVTLVWFDYPGELMDDTIRNDLDLIVTSPVGTDGSPEEIYPGNHLVEDSCTAAESRDCKNTVEQVLVDAPQGGTWTVRVEGTNVQFSSSQISVTQGYALVATGDFGISPRRRNSPPCPNLSWGTTPRGFQIEIVRRGRSRCGFVTLDELCDRIRICPRPCATPGSCPVLRFDFAALRDQFRVAAYDLSTPPAAADGEFLPAISSLELERREGVRYGIFFFPANERVSVGTYDIPIVEQP